MFRRAGFASSRAALLWGLVCFLALQLGLAAAIELWLPELRDPSYAYKARCLYQRTVGVTPRPLTIVMLGSSRTVFGLQSSDLEKRLQTPDRPLVLFNFGQVGAGPLVELVALRRLLAAGVHPDILLVEVLPPLLNSKLAAPQLRWLPPDRLELSELPLLGQYGASATQLRRRWWLAFALPWHVRRFNLLSKVAPALLDDGLRQDWFAAVDDSGWVEPPYGYAVTPEVRQRALDAAHHEYAANLADFHLDGPPCAALRDLLELCRQEHIVTALVWMPESSVFRSWYPPATRTDLHTYLEALGHTYEAPLIDAGEWVADDQFADGHHLLADGAALFTDRLGREVLPSLLRRLGSTENRNAGP